MKFKYVILQSLADKQEWAIISFPSVQHDHMINLTKVKAISAGFGCVRDGRVYVDGVSTSLNLVARPQDAEIIENTLFCTGLISYATQPVSAVQ